MINCLSFILNSCHTFSVVMIIIRIYPSCRSQDSTEWYYIQLLKFVTPFYHLDADPVFHTHRRRFAQKDAACCLLWNNVIYSISESGYLLIQPECEKER